MEIDSNLAEEQKQPENKQIHSSPYTKVAESFAGAAKPSPI